MNHFEIIMYTIGVTFSILLLITIVSNFIYLIVSLIITKSIFTKSIKLNQLYKEYYILSQRLDFNENYDINCRVIEINKQIRELENEVLRDE